MSVRLLGAVLLMGLLTTHVDAAKLYKIVDQNGNVTFSQFPPTPSEKPEGVIVEEKKVEGDGETALVTKGETQFCGDIKLPVKRERKEYFFSEVAVSVRGWKDSLERKEKQLAKNQESYLKQAQYQSRYNRSGYAIEQSARYLERDRQLIESMRDLRCALSWGQTQQKASLEAKEEMNKELKRLQDSLKGMEAQRNAICGMEPIYEPTVAGNRQARSKWTKCDRDYRTDIRKLEQLIRTESRKLERF